MAGRVHQANATAPVHAHAMGVVDHHPGLVPGRCRHEFIQPAGIAVHAEGAVADDQPPPAAAGNRGQFPFKVRRFEVIEPGKRRPADPAAIQKRSMVQAVFEHEVPNAQQRVDDTYVGAVAAGVQQGPRAAGKVGKRSFQLLVSGTMPADQVRGARTHAPALDSRLEGFGDPRVCGQPEIVVAAEIHQAPPVHNHLAALRAFQRAPPPVHAPGPEFFEAPLDASKSPLVRHMRAHCVQRSDSASFPRRRWARHRQSV